MPTTDSPKTFESHWSTDVFAAIVKAITDDRWRYTIVRTARQRPPVPTAQELQRLVEISLSASLEREEGRDVLFGLICIPPPGDHAACFASPVPLGVEQVRRLAPALELRHGVGVSAADQPEKPLVMWGITGRREDAVEIRAVGPGRVVVRFGLVNVARFEGARCTVFEGDADHLLEVVAELLPPDDAESYLLALYLVQIGLAIRSLSHGGTVVLLRSSSEGAPYAPRYPFRPPFAELADRYADHLDEYRRRHLQGDPDTSSLYLLSEVTDIDAILADRVPSEKMTMAIRKIAHLTAIDGAVVLAPDLSVICAGAVLEASPVDAGRWQEWQPTSPSLQPKTGRLGGFSGTRHRSAFQFVTANPGTVAVVCSQDGSIAMLAQPNASKDPVVLQNIEVALG